jgi:hypothetical protein
MARASIFFRTTGTNVDGPEDTQWKTTDLFIEDLASRMVLPDLFGPGLRPQLSTDGYAAYRDSIDTAFAGRADHGVLIKDYRNAEQPGRYGPPEMVATIRRVINGDITERSICTSHIERANLTMRTMLRRFTRLSLGFSKKLENLIACVALYVAHYNSRAGMARSARRQRWPRRSAGIRGRWMSY